MSEQCIEAQVASNDNGGNNCLLSLVEKVHQSESGEHISELMQHTIDVDKQRGVATLACFSCLTTVELTPTENGALEDYRNIEQCKLPEVCARVRARTTPI